MSGWASDIFVQLIAAALLAVASLSLRKLHQLLREFSRVRRTVGQLRAAKTVHSRRIKTHQERLDKHQHRLDLHEGRIEAIEHEEDPR